jgi:hypothetical protein
VVGVFCVIAERSLNSGWIFALVSGIKLPALFYVFLSAGVAQSVEQRTENPCVDGSIPPPGTIKSIDSTQPAVLIVP